VAIAAAIVAVVAVMVPGIGIGLPTTSHGGSPSDVYSTTEPEICAATDPFGAITMVTEVSVPATSNLLVYFSAEWSGLKPSAELLLKFVVNDDAGFVVETPFEWGLSNNPRTHDSGTVMWSFDGVDSGVYDVLVDTRTDVAGPQVGNASAVLENCALTAMVIPVA
jgi:hypothetical protein